MARLAGAGRRPSELIVSASCGARCRAGERIKEERLAFDRAESPLLHHVVSVYVDYRFDVDADGNAEFLCIFDCPPRMWTEFVVAHAGYAYRYLIRTAREPGRLVWTLTPHASVSAGASYTQRTSPFSQREQSAVVGARFGLDIDLHINRFFMGWTLRYEVLKHTKGSLRLSHFVSWNVIPIFAIGAVIGRKVRAPVP